MTKITKTFRLYSESVPPPPPPTPPDSDPPIVNIVQPSAGAIVILNPGQSLIVSGNSADIGSGLDYVESSLDSAPYVRVSGTNNWAISYTSVPEGLHTVKARARDKAGNMSAVKTQGFTVKYSILPPPPPTPSTDLPASVGPVIHASSLSNALSTPSAPGQWVDIPPGTYNVPSAVTLPAGKIIKAISVGSVIATGAAISPGSSACIWGINFRPTSTIRFLGTSGAMRRCKVDTSLIPGPSLEFTGTDTLFERCDVFGNAQQVFKFLHNTALRARITKCYLHDINGGGEFIQLGQGQYAPWNWNVNNGIKIDHNRMENILIGDSEFVSFKTSGTEMNHNTILRCTNSDLVLRSAHRQNIHDNILFDMGLRVHGNSHQIRRNQIINGFLSLDTGNTLDYPDATQALYAEVRDCLIEENIMVNTTVQLGTGATTEPGTGQYPPRNNRFNRNIILGLTSGTMTSSSGASWSSQQVTGNLIHAANRGNMPAALTSDPLLVRDANGVYQFSANSQLKWTQDLVYLRPQDVGQMAP